MHKYFSFYSITFVKMNLIITLNIIKRLDIYLKNIHKSCGLQVLHWWHRQGHHHVAWIHLIPVVIPVIQSPVLLVSSEVFHPDARIILIDNLKCFVNKNKVHVLIFFRFCGPWNVEDTAFSKSERDGINLSTFIV